MLDFSGSSNENMNLVCTNTGQQIFWKASGSNMLFLKQTNIRIQIHRLLTFFSEAFKHFLTQEELRVFDTLTNLNIIEFKFQNVII